MIVENAKIGFEGEMKGNFSNSGSFTKDPRSGPVVTYLATGIYFALAPSGSPGTPAYTTISASLESFPDGSWILRNGRFDESGSARSGYHAAGKRKVTITGAPNKKLREESQSVAGANFKGGRRMPPRKM